MHYVVGDIHANIRTLEALLEQLQLRSGDSLIFLGDYVDCMPEAENTMQLLLSLAREYDCVFLRGNHEFIWEQYLKGDLSRQEFLLAYGGRDTVSLYGKDATRALENNDLPVLRNALRSYIDVLARCKDFHTEGEYLALHAGLLLEQYEQKDLVFTEKNFFVRSTQIPMGKRYLDRYTIVAGHSHLGEEPTFKHGYINVDLGSRQQKYIGAFVIEENRVIRSDGQKFSGL